jgi:hypothetical protein
LSSTLARLLDLAGLRAAVDRFWPWLLIVAGIALVASSLKNRKNTAD